MDERDASSLVHFAYYGWGVSLAIGVLLSIFGALLADETSSVLLVIGCMLLFGLTPVLLLWRALMPRRWKRTIEGRGLRRL